MRTPHTPGCRRLLLLLAVAVLAMPSAARAQQSDTTPPVVQSFTFSPNAIDTSEFGEQDITVTLQLTDDLSGVSGACVYFTSPSGGQTQSICLYDPAQLLKGGELNGVYETRLTFPEFTEAGTWNVSNLYLVDDAGNSRFMSEHDLITPGFATTLEVNSTEDTVAPVLTEFSFLPTVVDTSEGDQIVTITQRVTDDLSGIDFGCIYFRSPSSQQSQSSCFSEFSEPEAANGIGTLFEYDVVFPQYSEAGIWQVDYLYLYDDVGNVRYYYTEDLNDLELPTTLEVRSTPSDTAVPIVRSLSFAPPGIDTSAADGMVTVTVRVTDDLSGVQIVCVTFGSPSGLQQSRSTCMSPPPSSGTALDGTYQGVITFPQFSEAGAWRVTSVYVADVVTNNRSLSENELTAAGFPTLLAVTSTTPEAPTITAITPGNGQLSVAFAPGADSGSPITNYKYSTDDGSTFITRTPAATTSPLLITGLTNGVTYQVRIRAVNGNGDGTPSQPVAGTPGATPAAPVITGITSGAGALIIGFTAGADGGAAITNYQYSIDSGEVWTTRAPASTASPLTIGGLANGATYSVQLRALNAVGAGTPSAPASGTTGTAPGAPALTGITPGNGVLSVAFTAGATGGLPITNYEYSTNAGASWTVRVPASTASPLVIDGLVNGTTYQVQLRAVNAVGPGAPSGSLVAMPSTTPMAPTVTGVTPGNGLLSVVFSAGADGGRPITNYEFSINGGATFQARVPGGTASPLVITGLTNGVQYAVQIRAVNANGAGAATPSATATPQLSTDETADAFNPGAAGEVRALAVQADGRILVGGHFTRLGENATVPRDNLGRVNADGSVDASFNPVNIGPTSIVSAIVAQPDGRLVLAGDGPDPTGQRTFVARLHADGSFDGGFQGAANGPIHAVALQSDGKILMGGAFTILGMNNEWPRLHLGRLNADGTVDATFNPGVNGNVHAIAVQPDGRIVIGGDFSSVGAMPRANLARLLPDGSVDSSFTAAATGGAEASAVEPAAFGASVAALWIQADGQILVGGRFTTLGSSAGSGVRYNIGRLLPDGRLDGSFDAGPGAYGLDASAGVETILELPTRRILIGGVSVAAPHGDGMPRHLARLHPDGSLDVAFEPRADQRVRALVRQPSDGKIVVGGHFTAIGGNTRYRLARLSGSGPSSPDTSLPAPFTDDTLLAGVTPLRAIHIVELRTRINAQRQRYGLPVANWTDPSLGGVPARAVHVQELREALLGAYDVALSAGAGVARPVFTDTQLVPGASPVRAVHIEQLRTAVVTLEGQ